MAIKIEYSLKGICGIYQIINKINKKYYIGSSKNLYNRLHEHFHNLRNNKGHNKHLQNAWNKYSENNFTYNILEFCSEEIRFDREQYYINFLKPAYNFALSVTPNIGRVLTSDIKVKISNTLKEKYKLNLIEKQRHPSTWKKVYLYDVYNYKLINKFSCLQDLLHYIKYSGHHREGQLLFNKYCYSSKKYLNEKLIDYINENIFKLRRGNYLGVFKNNQIFYFRSMEECSKLMKIFINILKYHQKKATINFPYIAKNKNFLFFFSKKYISLNAVPIKEFQELLQTKNGELSKKNPVVNIEIKKSISPQSVGIEPINIE